MARKKLTQSRIREPSIQVLSHFRRPAAGPLNNVNFTPALARYNQLNSLPQPTLTPPVTTRPNLTNIEYPSANSEPAPPAQNGPEFFEEIENYVNAAEQREGTETTENTESSASVPVEPTSEVAPYEPAPPEYGSDEEEEEDLPTLEDTEEPGSGSRENEFVLAGVSLANRSRTELRMELTADEDLKKILREIFRIIEARNQTARRRMLL